MELWIVRVDTPCGSRRTYLLDAVDEADARRVIQEMLNHESVALARAGYTIVEAVREKDDKV